MNWLKIKGQKKFKRLRKSYPDFHYKSFSWDQKGQKLHLQFHFECGEINFNPNSIISIPKNINLAKIIRPRKALIENLVFQIGIVESISYWKATCSPNLHIHPYKLSIAQKNFLDKTVL